MSLPVLYNVVFILLPAYKCLFFVNILLSLGSKELWGFYINGYLNAVSISSSSISISSSSSISTVFTRLIQPICVCDEPENK